MRMAFTLIEMLVVVTIIGILASLVAAQVIKSLDQANNTRVQAVALELKNSINSYHLDYNRFPLEGDTSSGAQEDAPELLTDGSNPLVDALIGVPPAAETRDLNPKRTQYASLTPAKGDRAGIVGAYVPRRFHDMWGNPFHILLDTNGDNQVINPDLTSSDPKISRDQARHLTVQVAVYSAGKDGLPQTKDDVASWR